MDQLVVGCVQLNMRLPEDVLEVEESLARFLRLAQTKRVRLLVFPQYSGLMAAAMVTRGRRTSLLKAADKARRHRTSFWTRTRARLAGSAAQMLRADFGQALESALLQSPEKLWDAYVSLFSELARRYAITVVAGSSYLVDPADGAIRHMALVFGPNGEQLGSQSAVSLPDEEHPMVEPGRLWQAIQTPVGRLGILIGHDTLYPEAGRLLAYAGSEILIAVGASSHPESYHRMRQGLLARVEENQVYGTMSFSVGYNPFTAGDEHPYLGRSLLAAPISMTPRLNGILVEMGTESTEGLITAEWDFTALHERWEKDEIPLRASMPVDVAGPTLSAIYLSGLTIEQATRLGQLEETPLALAEPQEIIVATQDQKVAEPVPQETPVDTVPDSESEIVPPLDDEGDNLASDPAEIDSAPATESPPEEVSGAEETVAGIENETDQEEAQSDPESRWPWS
ncbi:MAG: nitrilase-related carbon-nitrogen hydrolase [Chloroflexota bacterium]|nr:nitrilase-related carbon-nitrogen hydrolase [Chloroflexota bacterium]